MTPKEKPEQFITTIDLSKPFDENVYQFIYGSQLYGTLFAVYGLFDCTSFADSSTKINRIRFKLINYRGCVNIGVDHIEELILREGKEKEENFLLPVIKIFVKPLTPSSKSIDYVIKDKDLRVSNDQIFIFQRLAMPFDERITQTNTGGKSQKKIFFDTEFNYRDGYYETFEPKRPGHVDADEDMLGDPRPFPSPRCIQAIVRIKI
jgi:hypothetical protein